MPSSPTPTSRVPPFELRKAAASLDNRQLEALSACRVKVLNRAVALNSSSDPPANRAERRTAPPRRCVAAANTNDLWVDSPLGAEALEGDLGRPTGSKSRQLSSASRGIRATWRLPRPRCRTRSHSDSSASVPQRTISACMDDGSLNVRQISSQSFCSRLSHIHWERSSTTACVIVKRVGADEPWTLTSPDSGRGERPTQIRTAKESPRHS